MIVIYLFSGLNWTAVWTHGIHVHPCRDTILICPWKQGSVLYSTTPSWRHRELWTPLWGAESAPWSAVAGERQHSSFSDSYTPAMASHSSLHSRKHHCFFPLQPHYWNGTLAFSHSLVIFYNIFPEICSSGPKCVLNLEVESSNKEDPKYTSKIY